MSFLASASIGRDYDEDEDFLPPGFLPPPSMGETEQLSFLDTLEADLKADMDEGRVFLKKNAPKSASSDDLVANSSVLRSVLQDKAIPKNRSTADSSQSLQKKHTEEISRLKDEKGKIENDLQKLEMVLSLEKQESRTKMGALRRENELIASHLEQERAKSADTIRSLQSDVQDARAASIETIAGLQKKIQDLERDAEMQKETNDEIVAQKLQDLQIEIEAGHEDDIMKLLDEIETLRNEKGEAEDEVSKYKTLLEDKRSGLSATIRSLQRRMGAFENERDEFKDLYGKERARFKALYREYLDCKVMRDELAEETTSIEQAAALLSTKIYKLETKLTEKQAMIDQLQANVASGQMDTDTNANNSGTEDDLKAEVEFLQDALDGEIRRNLVAVSEMQDELDNVSKSLENERSNAHKLQEALEIEQFYNTELENAIAELEDHSNGLCGLQEEVVLLKKQHQDATLKYQTASTELAAAKISIGEATQRENRLKDSIQHLEERLATANIRFRDAQEENSRVARDAMDCVNSMIKHRLNDQLGVIESQRAQQELSDAEVLALQRELRETQDELDNVSKQKEETEKTFETTMIDATKLIQKLRTKHEESLAQLQQQYNLMEEDLLDALEREEEMTENHHAAIVDEQRKLSQKEEQLRSSLNELTKLQVELDTLKDRMMDSPYSLMDLVDLFRWCQQYFARKTAFNVDDSVALFRDACDNSGLTLEEPSIDMNTDYYSASSEVGAYNSSMASKQSRPGSFRSLDSSISEILVPKELTRVVAGIAILQDSDQTSSANQEGVNCLDGFGVLHPNLKTAFNVRRSDLQPRHDSISPSATIQSKFDSSMAPTEQKGDADDVKPARTQIPCSSLPLPIKQRRVKMPSITAKHGTVSFLKKRQSVSGISCPSKKHIDSSTAKSKKRVSVSGVPNVSVRKLHQSKQRSRLSTYSVRKSSITGPIHKAKPLPVESNMCTPKKDDLSRKLQHLSSLSAIKLQSSALSNHSSTTTRYSASERKTVVKRLQSTSYASGISPPKVSRLTHATPLKIKGQIIELLSPESPLITPAKQERRVESNMEATRIQAAWRRHCVLMKYHKQQCALVKLQACLRMNSIRMDFISMLSACVKLQALARGVNARKRQHALKLTKKALVIQKSLRMMSAKSKFNRIMHATVVLQRSFRQHCHATKCKQNAIIIQANWRSHMSAKHCLMHKKIQNHSVTRIQAMSRKWLARSAFLLAKSACVVIQRSCRRHIALKAYVRRRRAAISIRCFLRTHLLRAKARAVIQSSVRRFLARKQHHRLRLQTDKAVLIQAYCRKFMEQRAKKERSAMRLRSLILIQSSVRRHQARATFLDARMKASLIQKAYRQHQVQREMLLTRWKAAAMIQTAYHRHLFVRQRIAACCCIQGVFRGILTRGHVKKQLESILILQARFRTIKVRQDMAKLRRACVDMQRLRRKRVKMRRKVRQSALAIKLQSLWRRQVAWTRFTRMRHSCILVQTWYRSLSSIRCYIAQRNAVMRIANWWMAKRKLRNQLAAATKIQSVLRMKCCQNQFFTKRRALVYLQLAMKRFSNVRKIEMYLTVIQGIKTRETAATAIQGLVRRHQQSIQFTKKLVACVKIQTCWRRQKCEIYLRCALDSAKVIQTLVRKQQSRQEQVRDYAATKLQSIIRMNQHREPYIELCAAALIIQCFGQMANATVCYRRHLSAKSIQMSVRGFLAKSKYLSFKTGVIVVQSIARRNISVTKYQKMRRAIIWVQFRVRMKRLMTTQQGVLRKRTSDEAQAAYVLRQHSANVSEDVPARTRRSKRLRTESNADKADKENTSFRQSDAKKSSESDGQLLNTLDSTSVDKDESRRIDLMKFKVTELRHKLQELGVESKQYNKLRKAALVEMLLQKT